MIKRLLIIALLLVFLAIPITALASEISGALWYGTILISNNSTVATNVATTANISTTNLQAGNFLNAYANNTVMRNSSGADVAFMPGYTDANLWCMWVPTIDADSYLSYILYTHNSTGGKIRYFPAAGGMETADSVGLELGDNFTVEQKGWVNTDNASNKFLVHKPAAFGVYVSDTVAENITASFMTWGANQNETLYPIGNGTYTNIPNVVGAAEHWEAVNDPAGAPDNDATQVNTAAAAETRDTYELQDPSAIPSTANISEVRIYITGYTVNNPGDLYRGLLRLGTNETLGTQFTEGAAWNTHNEALARPGGGNWAYSDLADLQIGCGVDATGSGAGPTKVTQVYVVVTYQESVPTTPAVTATGISSGNHTVRARADETFLGIGIDGGDLPISNNLVMNVPLWHDEFNTDPITTKDVNGLTGNTSLPTWSSDGYVFDWTAGEYINFYNPVELQLTGNLTLEVWVKVASFTNDWQAFLTKHDHEVVGEAGFELKVSSGPPVDIPGPERTIFWKVHQTDAIKVSCRSNGTITYGEWAHVVGKFEAGNEVAVFINGVREGDEATAIVTLQNTPQDFYVGAEGGVAGPRRFLDGTIGEARVYDRALSDAEILNQYLSTRWKYDSSSDYFYYDLLGGASVPDNSENYIYYENMCAYWEYTKITIDGVLQQHIEWEYGPTFEDLSGNSHNATPTFRAASCDPDVSANMTAFLPVAEAKAPDYALGTAPPFIDPGPNITGNFTTVPPIGGFPLAGVIVAIANATSTPAQLSLLIIAGFIILAASLCMSAVMRKSGSGSIVVKIITIVAFMGIFIAFKNFGIDFWMLVVFAVIGTAMAMASRHFGWT